MDANRTNVRPNPREKANFLSVLLWTWTCKIFRTGYSKILEPDDLFNPLKTDRSDYLGDRLEKHWLSEIERCKRSKKQPNLLKTIAKCFCWEYFLYGLLHIWNEFILGLGTPILLGRLLRYFRENSNVTYNDALMYAGGICLATALNTITAHQSIFGAFHLGGRIRIAVCSVVYRKALKLSTTALGETAPGKVVNLVANDVNRFDLVSVLVHHMWSAPLTALIIGYFLYTEAGYAGILGLSAVLIVVPFQSYTGKLSSKFRLQTAIKTDERVRLMDEIISGVQVIKMYAWEKPFCKMIALARKLELKVVTKNCWIRGIFMTFNLFTKRMAVYNTLIGMLFLGQQLTAEKAFVFSSYFNILAYTMCRMFVRGVAEIAECFVAVRRIQHFLMYDEFQNSNQSASIDGIKSSPMPVSSAFSTDEINTQPSESMKMNGLATEVCNVDWAVRVSNASAKWDVHQSENTLSDINIEFEKGKLYGVIGAVGSGKSSLISAILGELSLLDGCVDVNGTLSYASQDAWVFGSTVRQNILFGQPYDSQRYHKVAKVCALLSDFKQFPQGDLTLVGERGSSLSGGQRARISLARSVYRQSDIYILDDPLSAVDTHVGKHLFEECIQRYLKGKTRILATHQLQFIKNVDKILLMENGSMKIFSNYMELLSERPEYGNLLASDSANEMTDDSPKDKKGINRQLSSISVQSHSPDANDADLVISNNNNEVINNIERTSRGVIEGSILIKYFTTGSHKCLLLTVGVLFILTQFITSANDFFVPILVNEEENRYNDYLNSIDNKIGSIFNSTNDYDIKPAYNLVYIYTGIVLSIFFVGITRSILFFVTCVRSSQRLHYKSFNALIRTEMRFFDTNPSGRILNRFSKDLGAIDEVLPKILMDAGQTILIITGSLILVCTVNPVFLVPIVFIFFAFYWIRKVYLKTSKNLKRLEGMMRSPVFTHLNATLNGLTTIRAYNAQNILKFEFDRYQDTHSSAWYLFIVTSTVFGFSLNVVCCIFIIIITFSLLTINSGINGAQVGLAITTTMSMTEAIQWGMRQIAEVSNQMMSVERILEYSLLPPEDNVDLPTPKKKIPVIYTPLHPPKSWPVEGNISFKNLFMRYSDDDEPVLKNLNLKIKAREKVGIVGRTGAGKSSLISALFRLAKVEGNIQIDGVDTGTIYLDDLRKNISIIPQNPVLFSGTLRKNLDPFDEFDDKALWNVLEEVELKENISDNGLDSRVFDRGTNFSVGQRQLVCLARAILRNNKILMLDEATANVDPHTDNFIQKTIRSKFAECTVLTVAHRLNTIIDSDRVLVMDKGRMVEFNHPFILLQNQQGIFASLVQETGHSMTEQLTRIAEDSYQRHFHKS